MAAEAESEEGEGAAAAKGGGKKKLLIMVGGGVIALLLIGAGLYFFLGIGKSAPAATGAAAQAQSFIFNLPDMTVNLNTEGHNASFLKLSIAIEVADQAMMNEIQPRMAKVIDAFQVYLRELRPSDLQGSAGIYRLKEELLRRVNVAIAPAQIDGILFKEILVQ
jgi:flagellar FliL protein